MRYDQLLSELSDALERGDVSPRAVERLMRRSRPATRPDLPGLLRALGALTMFAGVAMLYAIQYHSLGTTTQRVSPLIFPVLALAIAVALRRAGRPSWEVELAGAVGFTAYGMAVATIGVSADAGVRFGVLAGLVATAVVILMHRLLGITRLTVWGLSASLVAVTGFGAAQAGIVVEAPQQAPAGAGGGRRAGRCGCSGTLSGSRRGRMADVCTAGLRRLP